MQRIMDRAAKFKLDNVPKDLQLLPDHMMDWVDETDEENDILPPPAKKTKKGVLLESRFGNKVTTEEECAEYSKDFVPEATRKNTKWAVSNFQEWGEWRQYHDSTDVRPPVCRVAWYARYSF